MINKDAVKTRILIENTAQGILKHLRDLESNRARMQRRWIWELLQNARDASPEDDTSLVASIELGDGELAFRHNGRGFTEEEVAHLIFHGSTKVEDERTLGQYGSGFLTTHLLSPEINVSGQLIDGTAFDFPLRREITSAGALSESMDKAWNEFDVSGETLSDGFTTRFRYPIVEDATEAVNAGIETLKRCAPFVVVFNRQFRRIDIESPDGIMSFEVIERESLQQKGFQRVTVGVSEHGGQWKREYILVEGERASITVPIETIHDGSTCIPLSDIPRLFLGFPLIGTENFSFPAIINSFEFTPTENRDGVYLGQSDDEANHTNMMVIEEARELHIRLIQFAAESNWLNTYMLTDIPPISEQHWLNTSWLHGQLEQFVEQIRKTPAVLCGQAPTAPQNAILPLAGDDTGVETLWGLLNEVEDFRQKLPRQSEAAGWHNAVESWATVVHCEASSFGEAFDGCKIVSYVEEEPSSSTLNDLQGLLAEYVSAVEWLNRLYAFLKNDDLDSLIRGRYFVLDQAGYLDKLSNLYRDMDIDNELKDIADEFLGLKIRMNLRDKRLTSLADEVGKGDYRSEDVTRDIIDSLKRLCVTRALTDGFAQASARMMAWVVAQRRWDDLMGFPTFAIRRDGSREPLWLGQQGRDDADIPLAPVKAWPDDLQEFADLFPWSNIVADDFFNAMSASDVWRILDEKRYVRMDVVVTSDRRVGEFLPDEPLPEGEHIAVDAVTVTDLVFLAKDRVGIMARVRDSQDRARLFWRFLTEWLVVRDNEGLESRTVECSCGDNHRYFQAIWLVPLVRNRWVPQGNDVRDRATAQSLAKLLRGSWTPPSHLSDESPTVKLLEAIQITRLDLMREFVVSNDESRAALDDAMTSILVSTGGDLRHVSQFVEDMKTDTDLPAHLEERRRRMQTVHENQSLGEQVENLVKEALKGEGFTVKRTGIGSDFEIEHDLIEGDEEVGIELSRNGLSWLVEVKATRDQRVRMTAKQAEIAAEKGDRFLLCVVPVGMNRTDLEKDAVRANMRFVQNIGPRVEPLCDDLDALNEHLDDVITSNDSDIQLEIQAGAARVRVDNTVWENGTCLKELPAQL